MVAPFGFLSGSVLLNVFKSELPSPPSPPRRPPEAAEAAGPSRRAETGWHNGRLGTVRAKGRRIVRNRP